MIQYEDFSLKIEPKRGDSYPVIVLRSPAGEGRSSFRLPVDPDEVGKALANLGEVVRSSGQPVRSVSAAATRTPPQQVGDQLFRSLFSGPVRSLWDESRGMIRQRQGGLRIKLHIDPEDPSLARLTSLPWEFLYRKEKRDFLSLSPYTPIIRYLNVQRPYAPLSLEPPLHILVVMASPADYPPLDLDRERKLIGESWAQQETVQVEFMESATILALHDRLAERPYHVLHFMGHGDFDDTSGRGTLVMEDEYGEGDLVDGRRLGILLQDSPSVQLVFLNACESARMTRDKGLDPFAGVAAAMVMAGILAVVAMQFTISDEAAITFARQFYSRLARGQPVDTAVTEGRRAIRLAKSETMEWGAPVLFMRAPQGMVFQVMDRAPTELGDPEPAETDRKLEQELDDLYREGLTAYELQNWAGAARSFQAIMGLRPDYRDAAAYLEDSERQRKLSVLYAQARQHSQASRWHSVLEVFGQIADMAPDYDDPEGLLPAAQQGIAEQEREAKLSDLYQRAVHEMEVQRWSKARQYLTQLQAVEPGFRDAAGLLSQVERELARQERITFLMETAATPPPAAKPGHPWWFWVGGGIVAITLVVALVTGGFWLRGKATEPAAATLTPAPTPVSVSSWTLEHDFSDETGWNVLNDSNGASGYQDGRYFVQVKKENVFYSSMWADVGHVNSAVLQVDILGPFGEGGAGRQGIVFGWLRESTGRDYAFSVNGSGRCSFWQNTENTWVMENSQQLADFETSRQTHTIQVVIKNEIANGYVDDAFCGQLALTAYEPGYVGVGMTPLGSQGEAYFDNFRVLQLP